MTFVFIGHGTSDQETAKFVVAGPDITGGDFADQLASFAEQDIVVVHTTSSGYPFCTALSAPSRVIICATRSRAETYDTVFAQFFLEALDQHAADRDKNGRLSMFEAFLSVREKVKTWYTDQDRLPSEPRNIRPLMITAMAVSTRIQIPARMRADGHRSPTWIRWQLPSWKAFMPCDSDPFGFPRPKEATG